MSSLHCIYCDSLCFATEITKPHKCGLHEVAPYFYANMTFGICYVYFTFINNHDYYNHYAVRIIPNKKIEIFLRSERILETSYIPITPENIKSVVFKLLKLKNFS